MNERYILVSYMLLICVSGVRSHLYHAGGVFRDDVIGRLSVCF